jgi:hypothetical protein
MPKANSQMGNFLLRVHVKVGEQGVMEERWLYCKGGQRVQWKAIYVCRMAVAQRTAHTHHSSSSGIFHAWSPLALAHITWQQGWPMCQFVSPTVFFERNLHVSGLPMSNCFYQHLETHLWGFVIEWWVCLIHICRATSCHNKINMSFLIEQWLSTTTHRCRNGMMDWLINVMKSLWSN